ncbi:MAG: 2-oxoacid:acceptor oxidoreductase family protein [Deltaproteobacteria bacterium]|nr:2-oxoacid:acceptor oxidoreductase family protein [Deltaproteobacteria bacterium]
MNFHNIYITGVGGQGIGLLSETMLLSGDFAGLDVRAVDTHGLAQRGGTVESFLRLGKNIHSPLIAPGMADLVIALEINEALRGMDKYLRNNGTLIYYDTQWQPLEVRLSRKSTLNEDVINTQAKIRNCNVHRVFVEDLPDTRMQNVAILGTIAAKKLVEGITPEHYIQALSQLLKPSVLKGNLEVFNKILLKK